MKSEEATERGGDEENREKENNEYRSAKRYRQASEVRAIFEQNIRFLRYFL